MTLMYCLECNSYYVDGKVKLISVACMLFGSSSSWWLQACALFVVKGVAC